MSRSAQAEAASVGSMAIRLRKIAAWRGIRVLAWDGDVLYASRCYQLVTIQARTRGIEEERWKPVVRFRSPWWRNFTSRTALSYRLFRNGFHALAVLADGTMVAAVPGAIVTRTPASDEFLLTHKILRGTRPLHITAVPNGSSYWGEYFDNRDRSEVHIYASSDCGRTWQIAYTFAAGSIRHIHNIVYDRYAGCLWILTGDEGHECKILRANCNLRNIEVVVEGNQQARAVAAIPCENALYLATDTPFEQNHVLRLDRSGHIEPVADLASSSIFGCRTGNALFFSSMVEPSSANPTRQVHLAGSLDGKNWESLAQWEKDDFSMRYFQYGNAILPDGENKTGYLAVTTIAVKQDDLVTTIYAVEPKTQRFEPNVESHLSEP
jgi:hypothetical protein